jgi:hypothetical protein
MADQFPTQVLTDQGWQPRGTSSGGSGGLSIVFRETNTDFTVPVNDQNAEVAVYGLTAPRTISLPANPLSGQQVVVKDADGSLAGFNIIVSGNGHQIDGAATFTMNNIVFSPFGSAIFMFDGLTWGVIAVRQ